MEIHNQMFAVLSPYKSLHEENIEEKYLQIYCLCNFNKIGSWEYCLNLGCLMTEDPIDIDFYNSSK